MTSEYPVEINLTANEDLSILDLVRVLIDNLKLLIIVPLLIGGVATAMVYVFVAPTYTSTVKFIAPQQPQSLGTGALSSLGLGGGLGAVLRNPAEIYISFMSSNRVRDAIIDQFNLMGQDSGKDSGKNRNDVRKAIEGQSSIVLGKDGIVLATVTDKNAQRAADIANLYPVLLQDMMAEYAVGEANLRHRYLIKQVDQMREKVQRQEVELKQTGVSADMLKLDMNASVGEIANLKAAITAQEIRLRSLATYLAPSAPEYRLAQGELNSLRSQLKKVENSHTQDHVTSSYPEKYRSYLYDLQLLETLIKQAELAKIDSSMENILVQVIDRAEPAPRKSGPSLRNTMIVSTLLSGVALLAWIYLRFGVERVRARHLAFEEKFNLLAQSWRRVWRLR